LTDLAALVAGVEVLSLDAGNTVIFLDHARIARLLAPLGFATDAATLIRTEGEAKRLQVEGALLDPRWAHEGVPGGHGWGRMVGTFVARAGVPEPELPRVLASLWAEHVRHNLWSLVPEGMGAALDRARAAGVKVVIVSNSEGMLDRLFAELGIAAHFDLVADSGKLGVEKPDPRIFHHALAPYGVRPDAALHLGDSVATDVEGARAAGLRAALIDPFDHWAGRYPDVPRVPSVAAVADALARR
jgi:putative hydrolase of the HAD superfamily